MSDKVVYLMRGLPSSGKSYTAKTLAGPTGVVCETDAYFYTQVGEDPTRYDFRKELMPEARQWNVARFRQAVAAGRTPIVVDRGNGLTVETQTYARYALDHGYAVELKEPESPWWQELRVLLKYKEFTKPVLDAWAARLAALSRSGHRVSASTIRRRMDTWKYDLTVEEILTYRPTRIKARDDRPGRELPTDEARRQAGAAPARSASHRWVGDFVLNLAEPAGARDPNQDIRLVPDENPPRRAGADP